MKRIRLLIPEAPAPCGAGGKKRVKNVCGSFIKRNLKVRGGREGRRFPANILLRILLELNSGKVHK